MRLDRLPAVLLRLEGLAVLGASIALYADGGWSLLAYLLLILAPDLSMLGYVAGPRAGALASTWRTLPPCPSHSGRPAWSVTPASRCSWR